MTKITVKRPFALGLGSGQKEFRPGTHELSEEEMTHWAIPGLVHSGAIVVRTAESEMPKELNYPAPPLVAKEIKELDYSFAKVHFPGGGAQPKKIEEAVQVSEEVKVAPIVEATKEEAPVVVEEPVPLKRRRRV